MGLKTLKENDEAIVRILRGEFGIHNSVAWKIMKVVRTHDKKEAIKWLNSEKIKHMNAMDFCVVFLDITEEDLKNDN